MPGGRNLGGFSAASVFHTSGFVAAPFYPANWNKACWRTGALVTLLKIRAKTILNTALFGTAKAWAGTTFVIDYTGKPNDHESALEGTTKCVNRIEKYRPGKTVETTT
ncbi:MAG: hypothetical protein M3O66_00660 [Verrucomicrobiota bacterium]|nr:hypothetical protein [Verrucomicrobiota bacterium]